MPEGIVATVFSLNDNRALNRGFGDGMSRAFELVGTPAIFGGSGYLIDRAAGTSPVFVVTLGLFAVVGVFVRAWYSYDAEMRAHESSGAWAHRRRGGHDPQPSAPADIWSMRRDAHSSGANL